MKSARIPQLQENVMTISVKAKDEAKARTAKPIGSHQLPPSGSTLLREEIGVDFVAMTVMIGDSMMLRPLPLTTDDDHWPRPLHP